jgi:hypothetical protein
MYGTDVLDDSHSASPVDTLEEVIQMPEEVFERLLLFLERWHSPTFDPGFVGQIIKRGERLMEDLK